jgi:4-amino-4-deoxy-L-arabinose transferase-like glycosyltransferase
LGTGIPTSRIWLLPAGVFLLGLALRLYCLDCYGFWGDEVASIEGARLGVQGFTGGCFGWICNQTPLHYLLVWLTIQPVDPAASGALVRLPSAIAGGLTCLVVYGLGREMFGRAQGLLAALLLALSAIHLNYSQDLRPYAMLVFLTALSVYCLLVAERTRSGRWWLAFAAATVANLLNSYHALTLVMPSLAPYLVWVLWRLWSRRHEETGGSRLYAAGSLLAIGLACVVALQGVFKGPRIAPDLGQFSPATILTSIIELVTWFTGFGLGGQVERLLQLGLLVLALVGVYGAIRQGYARGAFLCLSSIAIPPAILALLSATYVVFQRYALFAIPFYFLLIGNGLLYLLTHLNQAAQQPAAKIRQGTAMTVVGLALAVFVLGAYIYMTPDGHSKFSYRPDFRDAARYLSERAGAKDTIVFADVPALGFTIGTFYWRGAPPAPVYDARDPRLFAHDTSGNVYWIISAEDPDALAKLASGQGASQVVRFEGVVILREARPKDGILDSMDHVLAKLQAAEFGSQPLATLRGTLYQARGDIAGAVGAYKSAGTYFPTGDEYLRTAEGYAARGEDTNAWREAILSKFWQPDKPDVHKWLAEELLATGYRSESAVEEQIAERLGR